MSSNKVGASEMVSKRKNATVKYSEIGEEVDERTVNKVLGKTKSSKKAKHAFDKVNEDDDLTEEDLR